MAEAAAQPASHQADVEIVNQRGLHARAAAKFVTVAEKFDAGVDVTHAGMTVSGHSIMGLMMLGAGRGETVTITTSGPQGPQALRALTRLVGAGFDEDD
ncbi:HPr family phosphocarrier protein [Komagataeibacter oboediens]|uniref:HPr family phosphocarrier protein n=1 Tax=Komagataeibacter oboediens TaxID=65958 RepID=A0A318R956_9PROT|nr:HPr family phosphocarrier protein [Komagataeibacter oboediens]GBR39744.1 phosphocarrier protein HPr [Komagataeibacter oboediens DSM 11826]MBV0887787.1 HPr family phosphocarrier protein [Komagataeibacter oboediens]MBV1822682.1 HPr family phosphocarrier protein [Komagataeibacter oboediens]MCK9820005.1 HPr family phosphocarrier protein [Komagataeibacter oboediens]PYD82893.1 HPr family phosphocarrier protein [Komagataeibacter oboediens]